MAYDREKRLHYERQKRLKFPPESCWVMNNRHDGNRPYKLLFVTGMSDRGWRKVAFYHAGEFREQPYTSTDRVRSMENEGYTRVDNVAWAMARLCGGWFPDE